ncbi:permease of the major facilitator superfamily [Burkholderia cenocepacia]|nr:permease of the major facilitator superfamily [Burkholderia cenocepacia]
MDLPVERPVRSCRIVCTWLIVRNTRATSNGRSTGSASYWRWRIDVLLIGTEAAGQQDVDFTRAGVWWAQACCSASPRGCMRDTAAHPLLDFTTLKVPTFPVTVITGSITRMAINAVPYLLPLLFQIGFGLSPFQSGLLLLASALGNLGMKAGTIVDPRPLRLSACRARRRDDRRHLPRSHGGWLTASTPLAITRLSYSSTGSAVDAVHDRSRRWLMRISRLTSERGQQLWSAAQQMTIGMGSHLAHCRCG